MIDEKKLLNFISALEEAGAEYICFDTLRKFIDETEKIGEWISVKERLPYVHEESTSDCVLVTDGEFIWMAYYLPIGEWGFAECTNANKVIDWTEITHWQPLPSMDEEISQ